MTRPKITSDTIRSCKGRRRIAALTAYDYAVARLLDEAEVPLILVGDSLGMVVLGYPDTTSVTLAEMEHHTRAVARAQPRALLAADLPFGSYGTAEEAVKSARRLTEAGAEAVKAEGGRDIRDQVAAIVAAGIPFLAHLGMLPQRVRLEGGYRIKGRSADEREALLADAVELERLGAFAIILELVVPDVAREIGERVVIPTIGIGSGPGCDGQILVTNDLLGCFPWFTPKFVRPKLAAFEEMRRALSDWRREVETPAQKP